MELNVDNIKSLMDRVAKNKLTRLEIESEGMKVVIEGPKTEVVQAPAAQAAAAPAAAAPSSAAPAPEKEEIKGHEVKSPIVGTFYHSPAPEKPPYVSVGSKVKKGDTLFIIESMKLMNEVPSDVDGTVTQILVDNAQPVEYGQPILVIE